MPNKTRKRKRTPPGRRIQTHDPPIEAHAPPVETPEDDGRFWPAGQDMPTRWIKLSRRRLPCPKCRRLFLDDGGQAVGCLSSGGEVAYFRCRACDHTFALPVVEA